MRVLLAHLGGHDPAMDEPNVTRKLKSEFGN